MRCAPQNGSHVFPEFFNSQIQKDLKTKQTANICSKIQALQLPAAHILHTLQPPEDPRF